MKNTEDATCNEQKKRTKKELKSPSEQGIAPEASVIKKARELSRKRKESEAELKEMVLDCFRDPRTGTIFANGQRCEKLRKLDPDDVKRRAEREKQRKREACWERASRFSVPEHVEIIKKAAGTPASAEMRSGKGGPKSLTEMIRIEVPVSASLAAKLTTLRPELLEKAFEEEVTQERGILATMEEKRDPP
eukprot:jgi/Bigna1/79562/fgenesh1_pg.63_\